MQYKEIGKTGVKVARLGLGCMRYPLLPSRDKNNKSPKNVDIQATIEMVDMAISEGINYIDTAHMYHEGMSEAILGHALHVLNARDKINLATKLPPYFHTLGMSIEQVFEEQCQRLRTDVIDFYLLHAINATRLGTYTDYKAFEFVAKLKKEGRIKHIGFSFHDDIVTFEKALDIFDWDFCQIQYNFIDEHYQAGVTGLKKAAEKGLGVVVMEPLKGGALAKPQPAPVEALWSDVTPTPTPADRALRWLFNQPEVSIVLSGMNEKEQLRQNIASAAHAELSMPADEIERFSKAKEIYNSRLKAACTACRYCMPCPKNVDIPSILDLYNKSNLFSDDAGVVGYSKMMYANMNMAQNTSALECVNCGKCVKQCPQNIQIPNLLHEAHALLTN